MFLLHHFRNLLFSVILLFSCQEHSNSQKKKNWDKKNYIIEYLIKEHDLKIEEFESIFIINNNVCNSCNAASISELKKSTFYNNSSNKLILLSNKDSLFHKRMLFDCNNCAIKFDNETLSKYGLLKNYPVLVKLKNNNVDTIIFFYGRSGNNLPSPS